MITFTVHDAQFVLRNAVPSLGSCNIPLRCLGFILGYALASLITTSQLHLRISIILLCCFA